MALRLGKEGLWMEAPGLEPVLVADWDGWVSDNEYLTPEDYGTTWEKIGASAASITRNYW